MNVTAESSFAPLEYYKKLTNCLANRKNLKLNISKIHGSRDFRFKSTPFITNRKIQLKFLANYQMRKQFNENQKQQREKLENKQTEVIFNVKNKNNVALNEKLKRKAANEESYINLPDSYFKTSQLPDLSLFKAPGIPPIKKQKIQILPNVVNVSNFTLASLFSGNFNPQQCSTPIEPQVKQPQHPVTIDPNNILESLENLQFLDPVEPEEELHPNKAMNERLKAARALDKMKSYKNLIDAAATYVESVCFGQLTNAIIAMINRIYGKHDVVSQSPRPSLISPQRYRSLINAFAPTAVDATKTQSWPIPIFYDQPNEQTVNDHTYNNNNDDDNDINPLFENTNDLFSFLDEDDPLDLGTSAIGEFDKTPSISQTSFFSQTSNPSSNTFLASTRFSLTPYPRSPNYGNCDDLNWLEDKFTKSMDMSWETGSNFTFATGRNDLNSNISAIFRSPPKTNNLESKKAFSRAIKPPVTYTRSESDGFSDKEDEFSWWFNDNDDSPNNSFIHNDTLDIFDTKFNLF